MSGLEFNTDELKKLIDEEGVVFHDDLPELKDGVLLKIDREMRRQAFRQGYALEEETVRVEFSDRWVVEKRMKAVNLDTGRVEGSWSALGEASKEKGEIAVRIAEKRALKRLYEKVAGEDFVNERIRQLEAEGKVRTLLATKKQLEYLKDLVKERGLDWEEVKKRYGIEKEMGELTREEASRLIDLLKGSSLRPGR